MSGARGHDGPISRARAPAVRLTLLAFLAACAAPEPDPWPESGPPWTGNEVPGHGPSTPRPDPGFPCDVGAVFLGICSGCHSAQLNNGATAVLSTREEVLQPSKRSPGKTLLEDSLARILDGSMPPTGRKVEPWDVRTLEEWIARGAPSETCAVKVDPQLPDRGRVCTSGRWGTTTPGEHMNPGTRCITCHREGGPAQAFGASGTIYPSLREPDGCMGEGGVTVEITDRDGKVHRTVTNAVGNFVVREWFPLPFTVALRKGSRVYARQENVQATRDCNTCHTADGVGNAPGRIVLPP
jgi:mono/diheme cytochrome c family protein